jgi:beta-carotene ketolase (CrtW type)
MSTARQTAIGLGLAFLIVALWSALHLWGVFLHPWTPLGLAAAPLMILVQSWLGAGLFIVAHDAMHGSLAPGRPGLNRGVGQLCVGLYAAFSFDKLNRQHHRHHRAPGTAEDPDFHPEAPRAFLAWYLRFFRTYFGWREFGLVTFVLLAYLALGARPLNLALFWGTPAILSSLMLFGFGTWLPHRHEDRGFEDHHNARSLGYGWWGSLFSCFHFGGFHREHHLEPSAPWWRLPRVGRPA